MCDHATFNTNALTFNELLNRADLYGDDTSRAIARRLPAYMEAETENALSAAYAEAEAEAKELAKETDAVAEGAEYAHNALDELRDALRELIDASDASDMDPDSELHMARMAAERVLSVYPCWLKKQEQERQADAARKAFYEAQRAGIIARNTKQPRTRKRT